MLNSLPRRQPLATFYVLAYGLSWVLMIPWLRNPETPPFFTFGPMVTALVVAAVVGGRPQMMELLRAQARWRISWRWYAVVLGLPVALELASIYLNVLFGAPRPDWSRANLGPQLLIRFVFLAALSGPLGEELGWRGFALPRFQMLYSALTASLIVGSLHAAWHLPLFAAGEFDISGFLATIAGAVVATWVFNNTKGSVLLTLLLHAANQNSGRFLNALFSGPDAVRQDWLKLVVWVGAAIAVAILAGPGLGRPQSSAPQRG